MQIRTLEKQTAIRSTEHAITSLLLHTTPGGLSAAIIGGVDRIPHTAHCLAPLALCAVVVSAYLCRRRRALAHDAARPARPNRAHCARVRRYTKTKTKMKRLRVVFPARARNHRKNCAVCWLAAAASPAQFYIRFGHVKTCLL